MSKTDPILHDAFGVMIHPEQCKGCGRCIAACPRQVLEMSDQLNSRDYPTVAAVRLHACTACGLCYYSCPEPGAISVHRKPTDDSKEKG